MKLNKKSISLIFLLVLGNIIGPFPTNAGPDLVTPPERIPTSATGTEYTGGGGILSLLGSLATCTIGTATAPTGAGARTAVGGCGSLAGKLFGWIGGTAVGVGKAALESLAESARRNILKKVYNRFLDWVEGEGNFSDILALDETENGISADIFDEAGGLLVDKIVSKIIPG
jgi:hypothetical protein